MLSELHNAKGWILTPYCHAERITCMEQVSFLKQHTVTENNSIFIYLFHI